MAGAASANSHNGPNSRISCRMTEVSTARVMIGSSCPRWVRVRKVTARCRRNELRSPVLCSCGSRNRRYARADSTANGTVRKYDNRVDVRLAIQPPSSEPADLSRGAYTEVLEHSFAAAALVTRTSENLGIAALALAYAQPRPGA